MAPRAQGPYQSEHAQCHSAQCGRLLGGTEAWTAPRFEHKREPRRRSEVMLQCSIPGVSGHPAVGQEGPPF
jgi:hypothetical protein